MKTFREGELEFVFGDAWRADGIEEDRVRRSDVRKHWD